MLLPTLESSATQTKHKVEFLGDSILADFDNQYDIPGAPKEGVNGATPTFGSESFALSWATLMCDGLSAECHFNAWLGLGMVVNCCSGCQ